MPYIAAIKKIIFRVLSSRRGHFGVFWAMETPFGRPESGHTSAKGQSPLQAQAPYTMRVNFDLHLLFSLIL